MKLTRNMSFHPFIENDPEAEELVHREIRSELPIDATGVGKFDRCRCGGHLGDVGMS